MDGVALSMDVDYPRMACNTCATCGDDVSPIRKATKRYELEEQPQLIRTRV